MAPQLRHPATLQVSAHFISWIPQVLGFAFHACGHYFMGCRSFRMGEGFF